MANLSKQKRERILAFLDTLKKKNAEDDDTLRAIGEIENELNSKKYGLVWEKHEEAVDVKMKDYIPVFTEDHEREISAAPGEDYNFLLEGDNLHSLKLLEKTHKGKIDVIYIDPPYNTGHQDFIYNDAFVDQNDGFLHSKWLSFMYERLASAKPLLSEDGVIVISIGYQEIHNLVLLCQELFSEKQVVCVTVQTSGGKPNGGFNFMNEYLVFVTNTDFSPNAMSFTGGVERSPFEGLTLSTFDKVTRPNQVYPIFVDTKTMQIVGTGDSLAERKRKGTYTGELSDFQFDYSEAPAGTDAVWPVSSKGNDCVWRFVPSRLMSDWNKGYIKVSANKSKKNSNNYSIQYLPAGVIEKIENGELTVEGHEKGAPTLRLGKNTTVGGEIPTIWTEKAFFTNNGSEYVRDIFHDKRFPYPKPLEFMIEILRSTTKCNSCVLDFFGGSGTTAEAVLDLNASDGGKRKFILCTNNQNDICRSVTYPRIKTVITGHTPSGELFENSVPSNLKYYKTDFVARNEEYLSDALLQHIAEMIQLENGIKLDGKRYLMILTDEQADDISLHWDQYPDVKAIYLSKNVLLTTYQETLFENIPVYIIPDYYFDFELREEGESW